MDLFTKVINKNANCIVAVRRGKFANKINRDRHPGTFWDVVRIWDLFLLYLKGLSMLALIAGLDVFSNISD